MPSNMVGVPTFVACSFAHRRLFDVAFVAACVVAIIGLPLVHSTQGSCKSVLGWAMANYVSGALLLVVPLYVPRAYATRALVGCVAWSIAHLFSALFVFVLLTASHAPCKSVCTYVAAH
jgi:hypothetical protein